MKALENPRVAEITRNLQRPQSGQLCQRPDERHPRPAARFSESDVDVDRGVCQPSRLPLANAELDDMPVGNGLHLAAEIVEAARSRRRQGAAMDSISGEDVAMVTNLADIEQLQVQIPIGSVPQGFVHAADAEKGVAPDDRSRDRDEVLDQ